MHVTQCTFPVNGSVKKISCRFLVKISKFLHNYKYTLGAVIISYEDSYFYFIYDHCDIIETFRNCTH